jgi:pimeloyl-ACP methyl ester carboxylesterase
MPTVEGTKQHYEVWGDPAHPAVVLVHGLRAYGRWFEPVAQALKGQYWVIAPDLRGRNLSPWAADGDYSIEAYVQDLAALADHCGVDEFALGGHSLGGTIIANFIQRFPDRVAAAILFDASPEADPAGVARIKSEVAATPQRFGSMDAAAQFLRALHKRASDADFAIRLQSMLSEDADGGVQFRIDPACTRQPPAPAAESWQAFGSIRCPTLQLRGLESDILSTAHFERIRAMLPGCENIEIPAAAHMVVEDNPAATAAAVAAFLAKVYPGG